MPTCAQTSHAVAPEPAMTLQFLSDHETRRDHVAPEVTSQGHGLHVPPPLIASHRCGCTIKVQPHHTSPPQPYIYRLPIYARLLMATLINFTGRQSNKALLWGGDAAADV